MRALCLALPLLGLASPLAAQSMDHMAMPGMKMPATQATKAPPGKDRPAPKKRICHVGKRARSRRFAPGASSTHAMPAGHDMSAMPGMTMEGAASPSMAGHDMSAMPGMDHGDMAGTTSGGASARMPGMDHGGMADMAGMDHGSAAGQASMPGIDHRQMQSMADRPGMKMGPTGDVKPVIGNASAPPLPTDRAADAVWGADAMRASQKQVRAESGGQTFYMVLFNIAEYQAQSGRGGYRWDGEAWYGGDINRLTLKTEGEGRFRDGLDSAEVQALYSRTIGPYWNIQGGVRHDFTPNPSRTYATVGLEGLAPNDFELEAAAFLSTSGDLLARVEGYYDQRLTQRLILQPRAEFNLSAQDVRDDGYGSGLVDAELGLRLRYEIRREFAPYIGVSWERRYGDTARLSRQLGRDTGGASFVAGIRTWF